MRGRRTKPRLRIPFEPGTPGEGVDLIHEDGASIRSRRPSPSYRPTANIGRPSDDATSYKPSAFGAGLFQAAHQLRELRTMLEKPPHAPHELRRALQQVLVEHLDREQRNQPDDRTQPERNLFAGRQDQPVVVEVVL